MEFSDSSFYRGEFHKSNIHGNGVYKWNDGREFKGEWVDNLFVRGVMKYPDGRTYEGEFQNELRHGYGVMQYSDYQY